MAEQRETLTCPGCGSKRVFATLLGCFGHRDSNTARCDDCKINGTSQDWLDLAYKDREIDVLNERLKEWEEAEGSR